MDTQSLEIKPKFCRIHRLFLYFLSDFLFVKDIFWFTILIELIIWDTVSEE